MHTDSLESCERTETRDAKAPRVLAARATGLLDLLVFAARQVANFEFRNKALPYLLSNLGFDVWVGNNRGTKYSNHEQDREGYWDYSFDELARYDTPAFINGILE